MPNVESGAAVTSLKGLSSTAAYASPDGAAYRKESSTFSLSSPRGRL